jgi:hypothetical protein
VRGRSVSRAVIGMQLSHVCQNRRAVRPKISPRLFHNHSSSSPPSVLLSFTSSSNKILATCKVLESTYRIINNPLDRDQDSQA